LASSIAAEAQIKIRQNQMRAAASERDGEMNKSKPRAAKSTLLAAAERRQERHQLIHEIVGNRLMI